MVVPKKEQEKMRKHNH
jgi:hypothetical protein